MYANLVLFNLGPGKRPVVEKLMQQMSPAFSAQKGFKGVTYLGDDTNGQYGGLTLWESKEAAEVGFQALLPQLQKAIEGPVQSPPSRSLFEVLEPKA